MHGGDAVLESKLGASIVVCIRLPYAAVNPEPAAPPPDADAAQDQTNIIPFKGAA